MVPSHPWSSAFEDRMSSSRSETELTRFPNSYGTFNTSYARPCIVLGTNGSMHIWTPHSLEGIVMVDYILNLLIPILGNKGSPSLKSCTSAKSEVGR